MELVNLVTKHESEKAKAEEGRPVFVTSAGVDTIEDDVLNVIYFDSVKQCFSLPQGAVLLVVSDDHARVAQCVHEYRDLFGVELVIMEGVPLTSVNPVLEEALFGASRVSYHRIVGDLVEAMRQAEMMTEEERKESINAVERARVTRKNGFIRPHTDYDFDHRANGDDRVDGERDDGGD